VTKYQILKRVSDESIGNSILIQVFNQIGFAGRKPWKAIQMAKGCRLPPR